MPPKRQSIGRSTSQARKKKILRASETDEQRKKRLEAVRLQTAQARSSQINKIRELRLEADQVCTAQACSNEKIDQQETRLATNI